MENNAFVHIDNKHLYVSLSGGTFLVPLRIIDYERIKTLKLTETAFPLPTPSVVYKLFHNNDEIAIVADKKEAEKIRATHFKSDEYENTSIVTCRLLANCKEYDKYQAEHLLYSARNKLTDAEMEAITNAVKQGTL